MDRNNDDVTTVSLNTGQMDIEPTINNLVAHHDLLSINLKPFL